MEKVDKKAVTFYLDKEGYEEFQIHAKEIGFKVSNRIDILIQNDNNH